MCQNIKFNVDSLFYRTFSVFVKLARNKKNQQNFLMYTGRFQIYIKIQWGFLEPIKFFQYIFDIAKEFSLKRKKNLRLLGNNVIFTLCYLSFHSLHLKVLLNFDRTARTTKAIASKYFSNHFWVILLFSPLLIELLHYSYLRCNEMIMFLQNRISRLF